LIDSSFLTFFKNRQFLADLKRFAVVFGGISQMKNAAIDTEE